MRPAWSRASPRIWLPIMGAVALVFSGLKLRTKRPLGP